MNYPTPHIKATPADFAPTVLMPGDPLRSKYIAENFLEGAVLVNNVRGVQGYTGKWNGVPVSVMASGMGMPSIGIYAKELYSAMGVENIVRIGSAGAIVPDLPLRTIVIASGCSTDSNFVDCYGLPGTFAPVADYRLLRAFADEAEAEGLAYRVGSVISTDRFYTDDEDLPESRRYNELWAKMGVLAVEMEAAALYAVAARHGKAALAICTVSDQLVHHEYMSTEDRQCALTEMITLALNTSVKL